MRCAKIGIVAVGLALGLVVNMAGSGAAETKTIQSLRGETVTIPTEVPDRGAFAQLGALLVEGERPLVLILYRDPSAQRPVGYIEAYDQAGNLLAIAWEDSLGLVRIAYDENLREPDAEAPARVLTLAIDLGKSI